jgi:hypothetical protein
MKEFEEGFLGRHTGRFIRSWSLPRAKLAFVIATPFYTATVIYAHFFHWPVSLAEGASFVAGASCATSVIAFFSKHVPEFDF